MSKVLNKQRVIELLKQGEPIHWLGGIEPSAFMVDNNTYYTVRWDTLCKLHKEGLIADFGYPELHGKLYLKELNNADNRTNCKRA